jgi:rhodanese-related sulfurtransferase
MIHVINTKIIRLVLYFALALFVIPNSVGQNISSISSEDLPEGKQTSLELYVSSAKAYKMWHADSLNVKILDVRTLEEYIFVGHANMAVNINLATQSHKWDEEKGMFAIEPNKNFINLVNDWAEKDDIILVMCRSGGRSAMAVNLMSQNGFTNVYNIIDGMEGDMVKDTQSVFYKKRMKNGWKNAGNPWTYAINSKQVKLSDK